MYTGVHDLYIQVTCLCNDVSYGYTYLYVYLYVYTPMSFFSVRVGCLRCVQMELPDVCTGYGYVWRTCSRIFICTVGDLTVRTYGCHVFVCLSEKMEVLSRPQLRSGNWSFLYTEEEWGKGFVICKWPRLLDVNLLHNVVLSENNSSKGRSVLSTV